MKVYVSDVVVTPRAVELPDVCPKCDQPVIGDDARVTASEVMHVWYRGCQLKPREQPEPGDEGIVDVEYGDSGFDWDGGGNILGMRFECACGHELAAGTITAGAAK